MKNASFRGRRRGRGDPPGNFTAGSLEFQQSLIRGILSASPDGILVVDEHDVVVSVNRRFFQGWGMPMERVPGGCAELVVGTSDQPILAMAVERVRGPALFLRRVKELYDNPQLDDHCEVKLKDGRTLERHSTVLRGAGDEYLGRVWFFRDVSRRKRTEATLRDLATQDPLTGVSNRRYFFTPVRKEFARARRYRTPLSVIVIDIDRSRRSTTITGTPVATRC